MRYIIFDIETQNTFNDIGKNEPALLDISVVSAYDSEEKKYYTVDIDELDTIWPVFERADALVGYNSNHFDIPILDKYYPGSLMEIKSIDILEDIKKSLGRRLKLDSVAEATLNTKKSGHGLQAITWWKQGELGKIKQYCEDDVKITKNLFFYIQKHGYLKYKDGLKKTKLEIDTSDWDNHNNTAMTHSLGF
jgi:DEAD/DEAH box helicase domain-containing protein